MRALCVNCSEGRGSSVVLQVVAAGERTLPNRVMQSADESCREHFKKASFQALKLL